MMTLYKTKPEKVRYVHALKDGAETYYVQACDARGVTHGPVHEMEAKEFEETYEKVARKPRQHDTQTITIDGKKV